MCIVNTHTHTCKHSLTHSLTHTLHKKSASMCTHTAHAYTVYRTYCACHVHTHTHTHSLTTQDDCMYVHTHSAVHAYTIHSGAGAHAHTPTDTHTHTDLEEAGVGDHLLGVHHVHQRFTHRHVTDTAHVKTIDVLPPWRERERETEREGWRWRETKREREREIKQLFICQTLYILQISPLRSHVFSSTALTVLRKKNQTSVCLLAQPSP